MAAPHPDDETLGVGGTIWLLGRQGWQVEVVAVTDGERSHPHTALRSPAGLARLRRVEQDAALAHLGIGPSRVHRLGLPDTAVAAHEEAVADALSARVGPGDWLFAPWDHDGHRDHDAVGRAAGRAAQVRGARLLAYPVWTWHWAHPGHPALGAWRPLRIDLPTAAREARDAALRVYTTQTAPLDPDQRPIVTPAMLERHRRPWEVVLT